MIVAWNQPSSSQGGVWVWLAGVVAGAPPVIEGLVRMLFSLGILRRFQVRLEE
jgi:hypothetical protein